MSNHPFSRSNCVLALGLCASVACSTDSAVDTPTSQVDSAVIGLPDLQNDAAVTPTYSADAGAAAVDAAQGSDAGVPKDAAVDSDAARAAEDAGVVLKPKCVKKDSQVIVIGDSYINWISHAFPEQLKTATAQDWRMLAVGGTAMGSGGIGRIPDQFTSAIAADPDAHTVLMDGGGNDILVPDIGLDLTGECKDTGSSAKANCQKIVQTALDAATALLDKMTAAGIRDVVYFFYPKIPEGRPIGGPHPNEILLYSIPMVKNFCDGIEQKTKGKLRCHFVDMIPIFKGHTAGSDGVMAGADADWFNDDIHPNKKGSQGMVDALWGIMTDKCIGQKSKSCCEE